MNSAASTRKWYSGLLACDKYLLLGHLCFLVLLMLALAFGAGYLASMINHRY